MKNRQALRLVFVLLLPFVFSVPGFGQNTVSESSTGAIISVSVSPGVYGTDQRVELQHPHTETLYYAFDESRSSHYARYRVPLDLSALAGEERTYTLRVESRVPGEPARKKEFTYVIDKLPPEPPAPTLVPGTYDAPVSVGFENVPDGVGVYVVEAGRRTAVREPWDGTPVRFRGTPGKKAYYRLAAYTEDEAGNAGDLQNWIYIVDLRDNWVPERPVVCSPVPGEFANSQYLYIDRRGFEWIRYSLNGEDPTEIGTLYTGPGPIDLSGALTLRAVGSLKGSGDLVETVVPFAVVATSGDRFRPRSGVYDEALELVPPEGSGMRYTLDDSSVSDRGLPFGRSVTLDPTPGAVRYVSFRFGAEAGAGAEANTGVSESVSASPEYRYFYVLDDTTPTEPEIVLSKTPPLSSAALVTLHGDESADIYYTTDGSTPDESSARYSQPFEISPPNASEAASVIVKAVAIGQNGRISRVASRLVTFDLIPPEQPELRYFGPTRSGGIGIGVDAEFGTRVVYEMAVNGDAPKVPTAASSEAPTVLQLNVPHGMELIFTVRFAAVDSAGNVSPPTDPFPVLLDRLPPPPPEITFVEDSVRILGDGTVYYTMTTDGSEPSVPTRKSSEYEGPVPVEAPPGQLSRIKVRAVGVDSSGNIGHVSETFVVHLDRRTPFLPVITGVEDGGVYSMPVMLALESPDPSVEVHYTFTADGTEPKDPTVLSPTIAEGIPFAGEDSSEVRYRVKLRPSLVNEGEQGAVVELSFVVDREPPPVPEAVGFEDGATYDRGVFISPKPGHDANIYVAVGESLDGVGDPLGASARRFSRPMELTAEPGQERTVYLRFGAVDAAGNRTVNPYVYSFTIDRKPPEQPKVGGLPTTGVTREPVTLRAEGAEGSVFYEISEDGSAPPFATTLSEQYQGPVTLSGFDGRETTYSLNFVATDKAGNHSLHTFVRFVVDRNPPAPPSMPHIRAALGGIDGVTVSWRNRPDEAIFYNVSRAGEETFTGYRPYVAPTLWTFQDTTEANVIVRYYSRDRAGNVSEIQTHSVRVGMAAGEALLSGVTDGAVYNARQIISRVAGAPVRYELTTDGTEPPPVTRFSPLLPERFFADATPGETVRFSFRAAVVDEDPSSAVLAEQELSFVIDKTPPEPPTADGTAATVFSQERVEMQLSSADGDVFVSVDGSSFARYVEPLVFDAVESATERYEVQAYSVDSAGNRSVDSRTWTIVVDKTTVFVAVDGDDFNDGSQSSPFQTIEKAVDVVRNTPRTTIHLAAGVYEVMDPIVLDAPMDIRGGFDPVSWDPAVEKMSVIVPAKRRSANVDLINVRSSDVTLGRLRLASEGRDVLSLLSCEDASVTIEACELSRDVVRPGSVLNAKDSHVDLLNVALSAQGLRSPGMMIRGGTVSIERCTFQGSAEPGGDLTVVDILGVDRMTARESSFSPLTGKRTVALNVRESNVVLEQCSVVAGAGSVRATAIHVVESELAVNGGRISGDEGAWIAANIEAEFSSVEVLGSRVHVVADRGGVGVRGENSTVSISRTVILGEPTHEFLYLVQVSDGKLTVGDSMLGGGGSRDYIGIDVVRAPVQIVGNTLRCGVGSSSTYGVRTRFPRALVFMNNIVVQANGTATGTGLVSMESRSTPAVRNNDFFGWAETASIDGSSMSSAAMLNETDMDPKSGSYDGNISENPERTFSSTENGVYRLAEHSECRNAGFDPKLIGFPQPWDFDGQVRPGPETAGKPTHDIGADEWYPE